MSTAKTLSEERRKLIELCEEVAKLPREACSMACITMHVYVSCTPEERQIFEEESTRANSIPEYKFFNPRTIEVIKRYVSIIPDKYDSLLNQ